MYSTIIEENKSYTLATPQSFTFNTYEYLVNQLKIDSIDMNKVAEQQGPLMQEVAENSSASFERMMRVKLEVKRVEKELYKDTLVALSASGGKTTEAAIAANVDTHPELVALKEELVRLETEHMRWSTLLDAYRERRNSSQLLTEYTKAGWYEGRFS